MDKKKEFITKNSGKKEKFDSGYQRDSQEGKTRYDLIPTEPLKRLAGLYERGAKLYGPNNWRKGAPFSRMYASLFRHLMQFREGDETEDHLSAILWNTIAIMYYQEMIKLGKLNKDLDDLNGKD